MLRCGIVGLPNVGKSTLFNAITQNTKAEASNYPFCTIEPNIGRVSIADERLDILAKIASSLKIIPNQIEAVDIAGLVKGASTGEGLGNKFLANIKETDMIIHVVRCFDNDDIIHVNNKIDPIADVETIETELILADLEIAQKMIVNLSKKKDKESQDKVCLLNKLIAILDQGKFVASSIDAQDPLNGKYMREFLFITSKPVIYVANLSEEDIGKPENNGYYLALQNYLNMKLHNEKLANTFHPVVMPVSSKIEADISLLEENEKIEFLESLGLTSGSLGRIAKAAYDILQYITYFTVGEKECRAWPIKNGTSAPKAAGEIHTDFEKGFIKAEVISYDDYVSCLGEAAAKTTGRMRLEGKEYIVQDGDVMHFKFNN